MRAHITRETDRRNRSSRYSSSKKNGAIKDPSRIPVYGARRIHVEDCNNTAKYIFYGDSMGIIANREFGF